MAITRQDVEKVALLSRLQLSDAELATMSEQLSQIVGYVDHLSQVDTDGVEPLSAVIANTLRWREDVVNDGGVQYKVLMNAPKAEYGFYAVPKVIE